MPTLRSKFQAIWELVVSGVWLEAHTRYDDYPDPDDDDVQVFCETMVNVGLLAALMFTVIADMLFNYADATTPVSVLVSVCILSTMLLYFTSCTWSVFNLMCVTQTDGKTEGRALLVRMSWRCAMPVRLWVYASILLAASAMPWLYQLAFEGNSAGNGMFRPEVEPTLLLSMLFATVSWVEVAFTGLYLIYHVAGVIQFVYACKREAKLRNEALVGVGLPEKKEMLRDQITKHEIVVGPQQMLSDITAFVDHVGVEHLDLDRFLRFLFSKYKPKAVASVSEECAICFAPGTVKRAELFINKLLDLRAESEVTAHEDELKSLAAMLCPTPHSVS